MLEMKKSMNMMESQGFVKGIGSNDVWNYLIGVQRDYLSIGRKVDFMWRKMGRNATANHKGFSGISVERILKRDGMYVLFGKAKWNNDEQRKFMKRLRGFTCERERFKFFGRRAKGKRKADHAFGVRVDVEGKFCYDSAMKSCRKVFSVENLAEKMSDINNCFVFDLFEVV